MASPNVSELATTTIENRSGKLADNMLKNNVLLARIRRKGNARPFTGGTQINEELAYAENSNFNFYSGLDLLSTAQSDVMTSATYPIKQAACAVVVTGLEQVQNQGKPQIIDLVANRVKIAEKTILNNLAAAIYSDGTGYGGKQLTGLAAAVPVTPTTGTYGGIDRSVWGFWQPQLVSGSDYATLTSTGQAKLVGYLNALYAKQVRGMDKPDLIVADNLIWAAYVNSLQILQRFTNPKEAEAGFRSLDFMGCDFVLDGGIGGFCPANSAWMLNTDYLFYRPAAGRDMVALNPDDRTAMNQDAMVKLIGWAGNMTMSNSFLQGFFKGY